MSNAELNIKQQTNPEDASELKRNDMNVMPMRRVRPLFVASGATLIWLAAAIYVIERHIIIPHQWDLNTLSSLAGGIILPIVLFWLIALVFQRTDPLLERRLSVMQNLNTTLAPIDLAEKRLESINASIQNQFESIEAISDIASKSMDKLEKRFQEQTDQLFSVSADMEVKSNVIRDRLSAESKIFTDLSNELEGKHDGIKATMEQIKVSLEDTTLTVKETIDAALEKTRNQANMATAASIKLTEDIAKSQSSLAKQSEEVMETSNNIEQRLSDVNMALITNTDRLRDDITELDGFASEIVEAMRKELILVEEMSEKSLVLTEKIEKSLSEQVNHVQNAADSAMERTLEAGNILNEHAIHIASMFNQTIENAREAASQTVEDIAQQTEQAKQQNLADYSEITSGNKAMIDNMLTSSRDVTNHLDETLVRARMAMAEIGKQLIQQSDKAEISSKSVADSAINTLEALHQQLNNSLGLFTETTEGNNSAISKQVTLLTDHTALLASTAEHASLALKAASENMDITGEGFGQSLEQNRNSLTLLEQDINKQQGSLSSLSQTLNDTLKDAHLSLETTGEKLRNETNDASSKIAYMSDNLAVTTQNIIEFGKSSEESITLLADKIRAESQHVRVDLDFSTRSFKEASAEIESERKQLKQQVDDIGTLLRDSADKLKDRILDITKAAADATGKGDTMISGLSGLKMQYETAIEGALNQFHDALAVAEENSTKLSRTLSGEADRVRDEASSFISKTQEIEDRIANATKGDFLRSSNMLIDSLQSTSIDIDKLLETDIPDDIWDKFISGDRSIFARRTVKLSTKESRKVIADKFISDSNFRDYVGRYMKDFEGLMERSMHGDKGSAMSITLISSTMGKLYVLLAQSLKKIH